MARCKRWRCRRQASIQHSRRLFENSTAFKYQLKPFSLSLLPDQRLMKLKFRPWLWLVNRRETYVRESIKQVIIIMSAIIEHYFVLPPFERWNPFWLMSLFIYILCVLSEAYCFASPRMARKETKTKEFSVQTAETCIWFYELAESWE